MAETDREKRQRRAQTAVLAIVESGDPPEVIAAELGRVVAFASRLLADMVEGEGDE